MSNGRVKVPKKPIVNCLTCSLCKNVYRDATTICSCLHTFCKECIYEKFQEDESNCCPVCKAHLGSFPEDFLRPDHSLRKLVAKIFPLQNSTRQDERSASFPVNITNPTTGKPCEPEAKRLHEDFGSLQESNGINDEKDVAEKNNGHLNTNEKKETEMLHIASDVSKPMADMCSLERTNYCSSWEKQACCEEGEKYKTKSNIIPCSLGTEGTAQMKKKKRTKRKPSKFISGQRYHDVKTASGDPSSSAIGGSIDTGKLCGETKALKELSVSHTFWFRLIACQEEKDTALPQIPRPYIRTDIEGMAVSSLNRYLAEKLDLKHETEVEVMCFGDPLPPTLMLKDLVDIWIEAVSDMGKAFINIGEGTVTGEDIVMELTYRRSKQPLR